MGFCTNDDHFLLSTTYFHDIHVPHDILSQSPRHPPENVCCPRHTSTTCMYPRHTIPVPTTSPRKRMLSTTYFHDMHVPTTHSHDILMVSTTSFSPTTYYLSPTTWSKLHDILPRHVSCVHDMVPHDVPPRHAYPRHTSTTPLFLLFMLPTTYIQENGHVLEIRRGEHQACRGA